MKYMGSKAKIAKYILPLILDNTSKVYIEPFVGGANMIDKVPPSYERIGYDNNKYLIAMWTALQEGWMPNIYSREQYCDVKTNKDNYADYIVGWCGFNLSYCGVWFTGYAGKVNTREGIRDYQQEAINHIRKQLPLLKGVKFIHSDYQSIDIPDNSIVYCDPPYANTSKYHTSFDHEIFWEWVRLQSQKSKIYISEYSAPPNFRELWHKAVSSSLSANGKSGANKSSIEKLFAL